MYCRLLAEALNDAGYDFKQFLEVTEYKLDVPWNDRLVKDVLWRGVQKAMTGEDSTTEPSTYQYVKIYETLNQRVAELTGVQVEWPHEETNEAD